MKKLSIINFFKGLFGGICNIIPGLSGSALLIVLNIYEKCINAIYELLGFKNIKKNILYLLPIGIGIILGTIFFGKVIKFFLDRYPLPTTSAFFGFILGTIPLLFKQADKKGFKKSYVFFFILSFSLGTCLIFFDIGNANQLSEINFFQSILIGIISALSTIVPGISGTVLLTIFGFYDIYLTAIAEVNLVVLFPMMIGFAISGIICVILIRYLLNRYYGYTFYAIIGFVASTIPTVLRGTLEFNITSFISILIAIIAFFITYSIDKISQKSNNN